MPVFSLPSEYGIGTLGKPATDFVDFLSLSGQKIWQVLPLNPIDSYNSPYMSPCVFAGNTLFIDYGLLVEENLLKQNDLDYADFGNDDTKVDYIKVKRESEKLLKIAFKNFKVCEEYEKFVGENSFWLDNFSNFEKEGDYCKFKQFIFFKQWNKLKQYANRKGIEIMGDLPIYPTLNGADVLYNKKIFKLDESGKPTVVSGTPPDAFAKEGQCWGSPVYDFEFQKNQNPPYQFWVNRIKQALLMFDIIRIDHFRAFEAFYEIPFGETNGLNGKWCKGPGLEFFKIIEEQIGKKLPVVAEDLGIITKEVKLLLNQTGFSGMRVLQFAFNGDSQNPYLPHNFEKNTVAYIGTHDNNTVMGWYNGLNGKEKTEIERYIKTGESFNWAAIRLLMASVADTVIFTMQDIMGLDSNAGINAPGTTENNWKWRMQGGCANSWLAGILKEITETYGR